MLARRWSYEGYGQGVFALDDHSCHHCRICPFAAAMEQADRFIAVSGVQVWLWELQSFWA